MRVVFTSVLGLVFASAFVPQTQAAPQRPAPSFDCGRASSSVEKEICASPTLATLDRQIGERYAALRRQLPKPSGDALKSDQNWFLSVRNADYEDNRTDLAERRKDLAESMRVRLKFLNAVLVSPPAGLAGRWANLSGEIDITRDAGGKLTFEANTAEPSSGRWVCDASGPIRTTGPASGASVPEDSAGPIAFSRNGATLGVEEPQGQSSANCGLNGSFSGSYFYLGAR